MRPIGTRDDMVLLLLIEFNFYLTAKPELLGV